MLVLLPVPAMAVRHCIAGAANRTLSGEENICFDQEE
jgi:hypothetical protein